MAYINYACVAEIPKRATETIQFYILQLKYFKLSWESYSVSLQPMYFVIEAKTVNFYLLTFLLSIMSLIKKGWIT